MRKTRVEESEVIKELLQSFKNMTGLKMASSVGFHYQCISQRKSGKGMYKHNMQGIIDYLNDNIDNLNNIKRKFEKIIKKV